MIENLIPGQPSLNDIQTSQVIATYTEKVYFQLLALSNQHQEVSISPFSFLNLLSTSQSSLNMSTKLADIKTGHLATINNMKIFVNKDINPGCYIVGQLPNATR